MPRTVITPFALTLLACVSCGGPANSLGGSIGESFTLDFDRVAVLKQGETLRIEYLKDIAGATNKVCKVIIEAEDLGLKDDTNIRKDVFMQRVTIERVANTGGSFPDVANGEIHFDKFKFADNGQISGDFDVAFENGRTLQGNFDASVEEVPLI